MKVLILSVGRPERGHFGALFDDYAQRVRRFGITFDATWVPEVRAEGRFSDAHVLEREGRAILESLPERGHLVALSPAGRGWATEEFSRRLETLLRPSAVFVIGGPLGLDQAVRDRAEVILSLSPMTFPHELARVVLAEQVYRAVTLMRGVPYHK